MRKKDYKGRCIKKSVEKLKNICRTYDEIQLAYLDILQDDDEIKKIHCNIPFDNSEISEYMTDFVCVKVAGDFIHSKMYGTKYLSISGEQRNITWFHTDFTEYYKDLPNNRFTELWKIQKALTNNRFNMVEICMMAMFLNVSIVDFVKLELPEKSQEKLFDE